MYVAVLIAFYSLFSFVCPIKTDDNMSKQTVELKKQALKILKKQGAPINVDEVINN